MTNDKFKGETNRSTGSGSQGTGRPESGSPHSFPDTQSSSASPRTSGFDSTGSFSGSGAGSTASDPSTRSGSSGTGTKLAREVNGVDHGAGIMDQVKQTANKAYDAASEKAVAKIDEQKSTLSSGLSSVAESVRQVAHNLQGGDTADGISKATAQYGDTAAQKIEQVASYFESNDLNAMYRDAESFARKNPMLVVGGAFVVGLLAARFLKSGNSRSGSTVSGDRSFGGTRTTNFNSPTV